MKTKVSPMSFLCRFIVYPTSQLYVIIFYFLLDSDKIFSVSMIPKTLGQIGWIMKFSIFKQL